MSRYIKCNKCIHYDVCCDWTSKEAIDSIDEAEENGTCSECNHFTPTADVVEVRHGYNKDYDYPSLFECSVCGAVDHDTYTGEGEYNYCPWCGAKMDLERRSENEG